MLSLLLTAVFLAGGAMTSQVYAGNSAVPDVKSSAKCSLTITVAAHDDSEETAVSGEGLSIYKVASLKTSQGSAKYVLTHDFAGSGISFDGMTVEQSISYASKLQSYAVKQSIADVGEDVTGDSGTVSFSNLGVGMYLVTETGRSGAAENYSSLKPFLVMVPQYSGSSWIYDVKAYPKTEQKKTSQPATPSKTIVTKKTVRPHTSTAVKTGDTSNITLWISVMAASLIIILIMLCVRALKKKRK